jgi:hypothetical protein
MPVFASVLETEDCAKTCRRLIGQLVAWLRLTDVPSWIAGHRGCASIPWT